MVIINRKISLSVIGLIIKHPVAARVDAIKRDQSDLPALTKNIDQMHII
jgi:protein-disulfide isomerase